MYRSAAFYLAVLIVVGLGAGWLWLLYRFDMPWLEWASLIIGTLVISAGAGTFASFGVLAAVGPDPEDLAWGPVVVLFLVLTGVIAAGLFYLPARFGVLGWIGSVVTVVGALVIPGSALLLLGMLPGEGRAVSRGGEDHGTRA